MNAWFETTNGERVAVNGTCSFGRASQNNVVLPGVKVSRRHALVHAQDANEMWLVDLGSSNGTFLNERRVQQPVQLKDGDLVRVGEHTLKFRQDAITKEDPRPETETNRATQIDVRHEVCWLMLLDVQNFTHYSQTLPADALAQMVGKWMGDCVQVIETNQGIINKYMGDGLLAFWAEGRPAVGHVHATVKGLRQMPSQDPRFRIVLHRGRITMGGSPSGGEDSLLGPELNFLFRMEKVCSGLRLPIMLSEAAASAWPPEQVPKDVGSHLVPSFEGYRKFFSL